MTAAALFVVPIGMFEAGSALFSWQILPLGIAVAVLSSALPYSLEMVALRHMPSQNFSVMMSLEPAIAALAGWLILSEQLSLSQSIAIVLVICASMGSSLATAKHKV